MGSHSHRGVVIKSYPIALPKLDANEVSAVEKVILSGWVTQGPRVEELENKFAEYVDAPYCCAVSNCTTGLHLALSALGVGPGDVVLTVSSSFIATANSVRHCGAEPVFVDIDPQTLNMDLKHLAKICAEDFARKDGAYQYKKCDRFHSKKSPLFYMKDELKGRLAAILVVHQVGIPMAMDEVMKIADQYGLPVVEDAACALGSEILYQGKWKKIGHPIGDAVVFSFHPRKILTTGDGGMICVKRPEHARFFKLARQHGMEVSDTERHKSQSIIFESYAITGFNYRMTDIQAAVGLEQLKRLDDLVAQRRSLVENYLQELKYIEEIECLIEPSWAKYNWQSFIIKLRNPAWQRPFVDRMMERGVSTRRGIMCSHLESPYIDFWDNEELKAGQEMRDSSVVLPLSFKMNTEDVVDIVKIISEVINSLKKA
jgi:perosamine synthetase